MSSLQEQIHRNAVKAFANHQFTIVKSHGVNREFVCKQPGTNAYWFTVRTWPGWILVHGDVGFLALSRINDMLLFCRDSIHSIGYFAEKVPKEIIVEQWSADVVREWIDEMIRDREDYGLSDFDCSELLQMKTCDEIESRDMFHMKLVNDTEYWSRCDCDSFPRGMDFTPSFYWCRECILWLLDRLDMKKQDASIQ